MTETRNASPDTLWRCTSCERITENPVADLAAMRAAGGISCCPERKLEAFSRTLTPPINDSGEGEPVAWRLLSRTGDLISLRSHPYDAGFVKMMQRDCGSTVQSLYAAPSPKGPWLSDNAVAIAGATAVKKAQGYSDAELDAWIKRQPDLWSVLVNTFLPAVPALRSLLEQPAALSNPAQALPDGEVGQ